MVKPDSTIIARTSLLAHGFNEHETLSVSGNLVSLMQMCKEQLQSRSWYDFGLRSLAPVVARAGMLRRRGACTDAAGALVASLRATFAPRLIETDVEPFTALLEACFPPSTTQSTKKGEIFASTTAIESAATNDALVDHVDIAALEKSLVQAARVIGATPSPRWLQKAAQLRNVLSLSRGAVVVGKTGCGKTFLWRGLAAALERLDSIPVCAYVVDPKALIAPHYKDVLIGRLDSTTLEWQDGIVALILRAISSGSSNTVNKRHWIVFDGDVDPEWAENLNSVLDDNRLLTLANGERIAIPDNVRFLFEVDDLSKATPATVSRCGVLHVDAGLISVSERTSAALEEFKAESSSEVETIFSQSIETIFADAVASVTESVASSSDDAVMPFACAPAQILDAALALCRNARDQAVEAGLSAESLEAYARRSALNSTFWAAAAPISEDGRHEVAKALGALAGDDVPSTSFDLYDVRVHAKCRKGAAGGGDDFWRPWQAELDDQAAHVDSFDTVVATADTSRNEWLLDALARPDAPHTLLCGPPGSGKTMTVAQSLTKKAETYAFVPLACASGTTTADIAQLLGEHCELARDGEKWTLAPKRSLYGTSRTVVIFLDEVNLVAPDAYGTPRALALVRQLIQHGGFWALSTQSARAALEPTRYARTAAARTVWPRFVALERVRVVGACNPPSDAGRHALPERYDSPSSFYNCCPMPQVCASSASDARRNAEPIFARSYFWSLRRARVATC